MGVVRIYVGIRGRWFVEVTWFGVCGRKRKNINLRPIEESGLTFFFRSARAGALGGGPLRAGAQPEFALEQNALSVDQGLIAELHWAAALCLFVQQPAAAQASLATGSQADQWTSQGLTARQ